MDKLKAYEEVLAQYGLSDEAVAYIGDDLPEPPLFGRAGLKVAVASAPEEVKGKVDSSPLKKGAGERCGRPSS